MKCSGKEQRLACKAAKSALVSLWADTTRLSGRLLVEDGTLDLLVVHLRKFLLLLLYMRVLFVNKFLQFLRNSTVLRTEPFRFAEVCNRAFKELKIKSRNPASEISLCGGFVEQENGVALHDDCVPVPELKMGEREVETKADLRGRPVGRERRPLKRAIVGQNCLAPFGKSCALLSEQLVALQAQLLYLPAACSAADRDGSAALPAATDSINTVFSTVKPVITWQ